MKRAINDPLERVIRPIVEGQIRGFLKEHPSVVAAVDWYKPRKENKETTFINSLAKRIVLDLLCPMVRARLGAALMAPSTVSPPSSTVALGPAASGADLACADGSAAAARGWIGGIAA